MVRLQDLARQLGCALEGDGETPIHGIAAAADAATGDLSVLTDLRHLPAAKTSLASAWLVGKEFDAALFGRPVALLRAVRPDLVLAEAIRRLRSAPRPAPGRHPTASIHPSAELGPGCHVGAFVAIGENCRIGADAVLHPHVVVYDGVTIGDRFTAHAHAVIREGSRIGDEVILQPGAVVGGDGFGFVRGEDGAYVKLPQVGSVWLQDRVEIQANSCVDRGTLSVTRIGPGSKIDNLAHVAHNCDLDANVLLCAQVGLAGSTTIEAGAILAGQVGVAGHCTIGAGAIITAQSGTHGDLPPAGMYSGSPAFAHAQWLRSTAAFARLPELQKTVRELRRKMEPNS